MQALAKVRVVVTKPLFSENEVVRLINGGPAMNVEGPGTADGHVWCTWYNGRFYHGGSFDEKALVRVDEQPDELSPLDVATTR